ncbi:MAG: hypothetical protein R3F43_25035 [bacterium]
MAHAAAAAGVMGMGAFLAADGFFADLGALARRARTPGRLLGLVVWGAGLLAALITNDAGLRARGAGRGGPRAAPRPAAPCRSCSPSPPAPTRAAPPPWWATRRTCSARASAASPTSITCCWWAPWPSWGWPSTTPSWPACTGAPWRPPPSRPRPGPAAAARTAVTLVLVAGSAVAYAAGADLAWAALAGFVLLMLLHRRDARLIWPHVDGGLLLFFVGLFIVVRGLGEWPGWFFERVPLSPTAIPTSLRLAGLFLLGSNVVSNVPFIRSCRIRWPPWPTPASAGELLAMASTFAGNLTLLGSVANIIVAESARDLGGIGFMAHLRVGLPVAVATTAVGVAWLWAVG